MRQSLSGSRTDSSPFCKSQNVLLITDSVCKFSMMALDTNVPSKVRRYIWSERLQQHPGS